MTEYALRLANATDTAPRVREGDAQAHLAAGTGRSRGGLRNDGGGVVTAVNGTMSVSVTPFSCWVDAPVAGQIGYHFVCDAAKTLAIADGHATLSRTDVVCAVVRENVFDGSGSTAATLEIVQGTPGAGAPALPAASVPLRNVVVPALTTVGTGGLTAGNISTDRRVYSVAPGGLLPVASSTERDALVSPQRGWQVYREDGTVQIRNAAGTWDTFKPFDSNAIQRVVAASDDDCPDTTLHNDPELKFDVLAGYTYIFRIDPGFSPNSGNAGEDVQIGFTYPSGSMFWNAMGMDPAATSGTQNLGRFEGRNQAQVSGVEHVGFGVDGLSDAEDQCPVHITGSFVATANGTVHFQWAKRVTLSAFNMRRHAGSSLVAERV